MTFRLHKKVSQSLKIVMYIFLKFIIINLKFSIFIPWYLIKSWSLQKYYAYCHQRYLRSPKNTSRSFLKKFPPSAIQLIPENQSQRSAKSSPTAIHLLHISGPAETTWKIWAIFLSANCVSQITMSSRGADEFNCPRDSMRLWASLNSETDGKKGN